MCTKLIIRSFVVAVGIALASIAGPAAQGIAQNSASSRPVEATPKGATISKRDIVKIAVLGEAKDQFSGDFTVGLDGKFEYPRFGRIKAEGLTTGELAEALKQLLSTQLRDPQVVVDLEQLQNKQVFITGEVRSVGQIPYANSITARQALIRAGGITDQASSEATIVRAGSPNMTFDVIGLLAGDEHVPDPVLQEGDVVSVQKSKPVFVRGFVNAPGPLIVRPGTTVQQVITMSGGISEKGKESGITIERPYADPKKKPQEIKVKDWKTEVVKAGDTVNVPKRIW